MVNAVCHGGVVRCAAPCLPARLQRDLSSILDQQKTYPHRSICSLARSRRGFVTKAAEGNGASPASTGLSIDLKGDANDAVDPPLDCDCSLTRISDICLLLVKARRRSLPVLQTIRWAHASAR